MLGVHFQAFNLTLVFLLQTTVIDALNELLTELESRYLLMTHTNKNTFMWEKRLWVSVVQHPSTAYHLMRGQSMGLVSASGIETMDWLSWSTAE